MITYAMQDTSGIYKKRVLYPSGDDEDPKPLTVMIKHPGEILRKFTRSEIFAKSKSIGLFDNPDQTIWWALRHFNGRKPIEVLKNVAPHYSPSGGTGLVIPEEVVRHWNIREGDEIAYVIHQDYLLITQVNGVEDPAKVRSRPDIHWVQSNYPIRPLPMEKYGDPDLRAVTLLSPIGLGSSHWIIAPGGAGKTWLMVKMIRASISLLKEIEKLHVIVGFIGDRPEDGAQYLESVRGADPNRVEFYQSPWSDPPINQIGMTKFVTRHAQSLAASGKNVVLFFDSITRAVSAHTAAFSATDQGGMLKGGILRSSVIDVVQGLFGVHGRFPELNSSLTLIGTALSGSEASSESVVEIETSGSSTTGLTRLLNNPTLGYPRLSVNKSESYTRFPENWDFRTAVQKKEMADVWAGMWDKFPRAEQAQQRLLDYVASNPIPNY